MNMPFKTTLEAALAHLKAKGIIKRDSDIMEPLGIKSKGTVSSYASGTHKMSSGFKDKFENYYKIKFEDFEELVDKEETKKPAPTNEEGLKEDLIAALKMNNALLEARVKELEGRTAPLPSIETGTADHLSRIRADMNYLMSLAVGYSKRALELQVPDKKKFLAEVRTIQQSVIADPEALLRQGTSSGTDDN